MHERKWKRESPDKNGRCGTPVEDKNINIQKNAILYIQKSILNITYYSKGLNIHFQTKMDITALTLTLEQRIDPLELTLLIKKTNSEIYAYINNTSTNYIPISPSLMWFSS